MGPDVHAVFGRSFPIRFDYLDTIDGGNLSVHCHPMADYMRRIVRLAVHPARELLRDGRDSPDSRVFLGLHEGVDARGVPGSGTAHRGGARPSSSTSGVRPEPSGRRCTSCSRSPAGRPTGAAWATSCSRSAPRPTCTSLRFYDWLRRDANGVAPAGTRGARVREPRQRADHVGRRGQVANLMPARPAPARGRRLARGGAAHLAARGVLRGPAPDAGPGRDGVATTPPAASTSSTSWTERVWRSSPSAVSRMCLPMPKPGHPRRGG